MTWGILNQVFAKAMFFYCSLTITLALSQLNRSIVGRNTKLNFFPFPVPPLLPPWYPSCRPHLCPQLLYYTSVRWGLWSLIDPTWTVWILIDQQSISIIFTPDLFYCHSFFHSGIIPALDPSSVSDVFRPTVDHWALKCLEEHQLPGASNRAADLLSHNRER